MKKMKLLLAVLMVFVVLGGCRQESEPVVAEPEPIHEEITILTLGDNLLHMPVVNSGRQADGTYRYAHLFEKLQPGIQNVDLAVIGQETVFGGQALGYSGFPLFNSPSDMGISMLQEGFDVVLHASNHTMDKGATGVENTLAFWREHPEMTVLGIHESEEAKNQVHIEEVKGAKLALLNYTYGTNGLPIPSGKEYLVSTIDEEKIQRDAVWSEQNADFTIAFMHWGTEYSITPELSQTELAKKMCEWGVDLIIGAHPHVIEPVEKIISDNGNECLVFYSLGNFVSRQQETRNLLGALAQVKLLYDGETVSLQDAAFVPIITHYNSTSTEFSVYPLSEYPAELEPLHGLPVSIEKWHEVLTKVFEGYDASYIRYTYTD